MYLLIRLVDILKYKLLHYYKYSAMCQAKKAVLNRKSVQAD